jgi:hypothetical protein
VGAVHGAEGVGHEELGHGGQLLCKVGAVLLLAGFKAEVFQQQIWPGFSAAALALASSPMMSGEDHVHAQQLAQTLCHGGQGQASFHSVLGLAQMGAGDDGRAVFQQIFDGGQAAQCACRW